MVSDAERIIDLYERHARQWDGDRSRVLIERSWLERFLALAPARASILDIGCGAAEPIASYLLAKGCEVTGVDSSATLVALCRARYPQQTWTVADMRTLSLDRRFDALLAWDSLFHLSHDDQRRMFPILRRHAGPGAALMFTSGPSHGEALGTYRGEPLYHASLSEAEYRALLGENGFQVVSRVVEDPDCGHHTIWLAQLMA